MQVNKIFVTAVASLLLSCAFLSSVSAAPVETAGMPEYNGEFVVKTPGGLVPLERETSRLNPKLRFMGYKLAFVVPGGQSSVPIASGKELIFYVRVESQGDNPQGRIVLRKMLPEKGQRNFVYGDMSEMSGASTKGATPTIPYIAQRNGSNFFEMRVADLLPGEYGWTRTGSDDTYLFSITQ